MSIKYTIHYPINSNIMAYNVPAVNDVFLRPIRKNAKHFYGRKKMWRSNTPQRGIAPTGVLRSLAAVRRRTLTDLLCEVPNYLQYYFLSIGFHSFNE